MKQWGRSFFRIVDRTVVLSLRYDMISNNMPFFFVGLRKASAFCSAPNTGVGGLASHRPNHPEHSLSQDLTHTGRNVASDPIRGDNASTSAATTAAITTATTTQMSVSFGASSAAGGDAAAGSGSSSSCPRSKGGPVDRAGPAASKRANGGKTSKRSSGGEALRRGSVMAALDRGFSGNSGALGGLGTSVGGAVGAGVTAGGGRSRRRGKRDSPGEMSSRG